MSSPHSNHSDGTYPEDGVTHYPRKHPRPLSSMANRRGRSPQLSNLVQGWAHSMMNPREKALSKALRRRAQSKERKLEKMLKEVS